ncbi:hypothetical protein ACU4GD_38160 [Cupriavidus basilensis]
MTRAGRAATSTRPQGRRSHGRPRLHLALELLLVVMVIAGIADLAGDAVNASPNERGRVLDDGQRIAHPHGCSNWAQEEAQLRARPIAWEADTGGRRFLQATPRRMDPADRRICASPEWRLPLTAAWQ